MKHIKKFNESNSNELDFETFKEIMYELGDEYQINYEDFSKDKDDPFFDSWIDIPVPKDYAIDSDIPYLNYDFLDIPSSDEPTSISDVLGN
jgi:hypothetical protein